VNLKGFMPSKDNIEQVKIIQEKIDRAKSLVIVDYSGTKVNELTALRNELKEAGGEMFVTKNTLIDIAFGKGKLAESLTGMNAIIFSYEDAVSGLKALFNFHKDKNKLSIKQGFMEDKVLSIDEVKSLSQLPSKSELVVMLIQRLKSPGQGLVNTLTAKSKELVYVLKAIADKKE
jgi:large subunit ribosomal protein L10